MERTVDLTNTSSEQLDHILESQKIFFRTEATLDTGFRKHSLKALYNAIEAHEQELAEAILKDLRKSYEEVYLTEISIVKAEIKEALRNIGRWSKRERRKTPVTLFGSKSYIVKEPLGTALIVSPWNYPYPASAESACRSNCSRLHGGPEAFSVCPKPLACR